MKFVFLIVFLLNGCFFGPVQELHDQIEETYFGNEFLNIPTPLVELKKNISVDLDVMWKKNIGEHNGENFDIFNVDNFLFTATSDGNIKKLDIESGDILWEENIGITITSGISGDAENILFSTADGFLWCMDHDGELVWKVLLEGIVNSLPIIYDSMIVVKINSYKIIQLNIKDGSVIWKYQAAIPPLTFKSEGKLAHSDNVIYLGLPGGKLIAIDSPTGGLVWESNISRAKGSTDIERANDITSHPVIDGPVIFGITTNGDISSLDRRNGKTIWTRPVSSFYGMAFNGSSLFISHDSGSIYSLNKNDGEVEWRQGALQFRRIRTGTLIQDYIVFGDYDGYIHLLSSANGSVLARIKLDDSQILNNIMQIDDSLVILMTAAGEIICVKVGEQIINDELEVENIQTSTLTDDSKINEEVNASKKHRIFDVDNKDFLEEEELEAEENKPSKNKKHRVFDKNKKEKGILDWLF
jgi:outer membrane protein assembly factor BamB